MLQDSVIFHHSTQFATKIAAICRLYIGLKVCYKYYRKNIVVLVWPGAHAPITVLSRPTTVFHTTIGVCKILSRSVEIRQYEGQNLFLRKHRERPSLCLAVNNIHTLHYSFKCTGLEVYETLTQHQKRLTDLYHNHNWLFHDHLPQYHQVMLTCYI